MKREMEILSPASYGSSSTNWVTVQSKGTMWTVSENKVFENALAVYDKDTPDRWQKVAALIPGKSASDVMRQYKELEADVSDIEAGLVPVPGYESTTTGYAFEWVNGSSFVDGLKQSYGIGGKRSLSTRSVIDQERKKGVPWTEKEHKLFLMGLKKYGKGDWRNISRNFVATRTPTQVASHAQKYFIRQLSGGKDKRRASIHDITTVNLNDARTPSPDNIKPISPDNSSSRLSMHPNSTTTPMIGRTSLNWNQHNNRNGGATIVFNQPHANINMFMSPSCDLVREYEIGPQNMVFQMQSGQQYSHG